VSPSCEAMAGMAVVPQKKMVMMARDEHETTL
jgi:hypothetical protein